MINVNSLSMTLCTWQQVWQFSIPKKRYGKCYGQTSIFAFDIL